MTRFFLKQYKFVAACILVSVFFFVVAPATTLAFTPDFAPIRNAAGQLDWTDWFNPLNWMPLALLIVVYVFFSLAAGFVSVVGFLLDTAVNFNADIIHSTIALQGWLVMRNFANLAIVVSIIFIAVATIVGREEYNIRSFLARLIVMALLINFTFVISGLFVDASSVFTNFFKDKILGGNAQLAFSETINSSLGIAQFLEPSESLSQNFANAVDKLANLYGAVKDLFFNTVFLLVAGVILANLAVLYLVRYFAIVTLLIIAPLAWILYAFPGLEHYSKQWWRTFLQWIVFLPVSMFFIYLGVISMINFNGGEVAAATKSVPAHDGFGAKHMNLLFGFGFLLTAMMAGKFVGGGAADVGFSLAGKMKGALTGATGAVGGFAVGRFLNRQVDVDGKKMTRAEAWKLGLAKRGYVGAANIVGGMAEANKKNWYGEGVEDYKQKYAGLSKQELVAAMKVKAGSGLVSDEERLAMAQRATELRAWNGLDAEEKQSYAAAARSKKDRHDVLAANPELISDAEEAHDIVGPLGVGLIAKLGASATQGNSEGTKALLGKIEKIHLDAMYREGNDDLLKAVIPKIIERITSLKANSNWGEVEIAEARRLNGIIDGVSNSPGHPLRSYFGSSVNLENIVNPAIIAAQRTRETQEASAAQATRQAAETASTTAAAAAAQASRVAAENAERQAEEERNIGKD